MAMENLRDGALTVLVTVLVVAILTSVLFNMQETNKQRFLTGVTNYTLTVPAPGTPIGLGQNDLQSITEIHNTSEIVTNTVNYTFDLRQGSITFNDANKTAQSINVSYQYYTKNAQYNATNQGLLSLTTMQQNMPTLVIVFIASIIVATIYAYFKLN